MSAPPRSDRDLAAAIAARDPRAVAELLDRHRNAVYRLTRGRTGDAGEAEDLTQETFIAAIDRIRGYDASSSMRTWLLAIALNKCRDWARRRRVRSFFGLALPLAAAAPVREDGPDPEKIAADRQQLASAWRAIAALPASLAEPLVLTAIEGLSQAEAGALLGIGAKAIENRVARARRALRETL